MLKGFLTLLAILQPCHVHSCVALVGSLGDHHEQPFKEEHNDEGHYGHVPCRLLLLLLIYDADLLLECEPRALLAVATTHVLRKRGPQRYRPSAL